LIHHRSNQTERLVEALAARLAEPADPFRPDWVLVEARGLGVWVQQQVAHRNGVCGNVEFLRPAEALQRLLQRLDPDPPAPWSDGRLRWALLFALEDRLDHPAFDAVKRWSLEDGPEYVQRRLSSLAAELAPRFEKYALYRPQETRGWSANGAWDHVLWDDLRALDELDPADRVERAISLLGTADEEALPARVAAFTVGTLPPAFLALLKAVDARTPVHIHSLRVPSLDHPLAASLGGQPATLDGLLADVTVSDDFVVPERPGVLGDLQRALVGAPNSATSTPRPTLRVHGCVGDLRQAEVLRDVLHECLAADDTLRPRDILVMCSDMATLGPLVRAVFAKGPRPGPWRDGEPLPALPFRLADRGLSETNRAAAALLAAMDLLDTRFEVRAVLELMALPAVAAHHGVDADSLEGLASVLARVHVHWAADAAHRGEQPVPSGEHFTWRQGLDRLLLGLALAEDADILGLRAAAGMDVAEASHAIGAVAQVVDHLIGLRAELTTPRTADAWRSELLALLETLCGTKGGETALTRRAIRSLAADAASDRPVSWPPVRGMLTSALSLPEAGRGYLAGAVTVSDLVPLRSVPFRVIAVLGLDDDRFPRTSTEPGFDRLAEAPKPGDRSVRLDDRALFLETVLSARQRLELFYSDRSEVDGRKRPPATVLAELLEHAPAQKISHPLQPFAVRRFDGGTFAFDAQQAAAAASLQTALDDKEPSPFLANLLAAPEPREWPLRDVQRFFRSPCAWFFRQVLGVGMYDRRDELSDTEPLDWPADALESWAWRDAYVHARLNGDADVLATWHAEGRLPLGTLGRLMGEAIADEAEPLVSQLLAARTLPRDRLSIRWRHEELSLSGSAETFGGTQLFWTVSRFPNAKLRVKAHLAHVALCASGHAPQTRIVGAAYDRTWAPINPVAASTRLGELMNLVELGQRTPLMFWPDPSHAWASSTADKRARAAWQEWDKILQRERESAWVMGDQPPMWNVTRVPVPEDHDFQTLADLVIGPILGAS
jgi:exodeoxyribonuclease V gamma subunit